MKKLWIVALAAWLPFVLSCNRENEVQGSLVFDENQLTIPASGGEKTVSLTTDLVWTGESSAPWLTLEPRSGKGSALLTVRAEANTTGEVRKATVLLKATGNTRITGSVSVLQEAGSGEDPVDVILGDETAYAVIGSWDWDHGDKPMREFGNWVVYQNLHLTPTLKFKIRKDASWTENWGAGVQGEPGDGQEVPVDKRITMGQDGKDMHVGAEGDYDLYFSPRALILYLMPAGAPWTHNSEGDAEPDEPGDDPEDRPVPDKPGAPTGWSLIGSWDEWGSDIELLDYGNFAMAKSVEWPSNVSFKIRKNHGWDESFGSGKYVDGGKTEIQKETRVNLTPEGNNILLKAAGTYDVYFSEAARILYVMPEGAEWTHNSEGTFINRAPDESPWSIVGTHVSWDATVGTKMYVDGHWHIAKEVSLTSTDQFKFVCNGSWDVNLGYGNYVDGSSTRVGTDTRLELNQGGNNMTLGAAGSYDFYLSPENNIAYILPAGAEFSHVAEGKAGFLLGGSALTETVTTKRSGLTYQINVYSFADSNGDGWGDFKGIEQHLNYIDALGCTAIWLSPIHPAQSYHGYDVKDYTKVNPRFGTEADFQSLVTAAHAKGIKVYLDYVVNHTGNEHFWFEDCKKNGPESPYWSYYTFSKNPSTEWRTLPQTASSGYDSGQWFQVTVGVGGKVRYRLDLDWTSPATPKLTATKTTEAVTSGGHSGYYLWWGDSQCTEFLQGSGAGLYYMVLDFESEWGCLIREGENGGTWTPGKKWGVQSPSDQLEDGVPMTLYHNVSDNDAVYNIMMPQGETWQYHSSQYTGVFADISYGPVSSCETSGAFKDITASVDKWLGLGVDGLRLDAVKHVYNNSTSDENPEFWRKFYDRVNQTYRTNHSEDIFMVGENLSWAGDCAPYYKGLPSLFNFSFWWDLRNVLNNENAFVEGKKFGARLSEIRGWFEGVRPGKWVDSIKLSNHDEDRTASSLGKFTPKIGLAACFLLTSGGKPFIYQGEELGYWGTKGNGDEFIRTPIMWKADGTGMARAGVNNKVDAAMLTSEISVESQAADNNSILALYRAFGKAMNLSPALADGWIENDDSNHSSKIASWYIHQNGVDKVCLVIHNVTGSTVTVDRSAHQNNLSNILISNGKVSVSDYSVTMGPYSSVVFALN